MREQYLKMVMGNRKITLTINNRQLTTAPVLYPEIIDQVIGWGITSISVEPESVERTYQAIARAEQRLILAAARKQLGNL